MYFGTLLIVIWLGAAALGDGSAGVVNAIYGFWLVQIVLFLATWALFHHMLGGIRHFIWDTGRGYDLKSVDRLSTLTIVLSVLLTVIVWAVAFKLRGGL